MGLLYFLALCSGPHDTLAAMYVIGNVFPTSAPPTSIMGPQPPVAVIRGPGLSGANSGISLILGILMLGGFLWVTEKSMLAKQRREERQRSR